MPTLYKLPVRVQVTLLSWSIRKKMYIIKISAWLHNSTFYMEYNNVSLQHDNTVYLHAKYVSR